MERDLFWGMNVATVYGFALIIVALILALIYDFFCRGREKIDNANETKGAQ